MTIRATITGLDSLKAKLAALSNAAAGQALAQAVVVAALPIQNEAKAKAPYRSGTLSRGITNQVVEQSATHAKVVISTSRIPYARIHEFGGTIRPKNGKWLSFQDSSGQWHRVAQVTIPARPYLRPAFDTKKAEAINEFKDALHELIMAALQ